MTIPAAPLGHAKGQAVPGTMEWDGAVNAWHVAGDVFRMGRREWLTEAGWRQVHRLPLGLAQGRCRNRHPDS